MNMPMTNMAQQLLQVEIEAAAWDYADPRHRLIRTAPENIGATAAMRTHYRNGMTAGFAQSAITPAGWIQFIDGVHTQNFCRDESELAMCKNMEKFFAVNKTVEYVPVYAAAPVQPAAARSNEKQKLTVGVSITNEGAHISVQLNTDGDTMVLYADRHTLGEDTVAIIDIPGEFEISPFRRDYERQAVLRSAASLCDAALDDAANLCDQWAELDAPGAVKGRSIRLANAIRELKSEAAIAVTYAQQDEVRS